MMVGIIISLLMAMFILLAKFNQRQITDFAQNSQLHFNLKSAFEIARSVYFTADKNNRWIKNSNNDDSIKIKRINWGAYLLITAETKNRHHSLSQCGFYGTHMSADTGLVVSDNNRPVGLAGSVVIKANCYLPSGGIKPAFIEGQSYMGNVQNANFIKSGPIQIAELSETFKKGISEQQIELINAYDSLINAFPSELTNPFRKKTIVVEVSQRLSHIKFKDNVKIISENEILIDSTCHLENVLIIAKKVRFEQGFRGSVHVVALDSIIAEKETNFEFPSSFVLSSNDAKDKTVKCIMMGEKSKFNGGMVAFDHSTIHVSNVFIKLNATGEVNGFVYSSGYLNVEGKLNANVFCNRLLLKTPSAAYENHILACEIDPRKYANLLGIPCATGKGMNLILCKNLGR